MKNPPRWLFGAFFVSGFCGLVYQIVWLRLAYASFGINTQVLSVVLSVFMAGLGAGSWVGGLLAARWARQSPRLPLYAYALAESLIGLGAFLVPLLFLAGERQLLVLGGAGSASYLFSSALVILAVLFPWCFCMGCTFPLALGFLQKNKSISAKSFSFLYTANVLGAMTGVLFSCLFLIEWLGFRGTLAVTALLNFSISLFVLGVAANADPSLSIETPFSQTRPSPKNRKENTLLLLGMTGFISMALEVVWTRAFTVILKTQVYSFAALLFTYLLATAIGSTLYRRDARQGASLSTRRLLGYAALLVLVPVAFNDARLHHLAAGVLISLVPFCVILGYLTPQLVDAYSQGRPEKAGRAYAVNIAGCIVGPLAASYLLLPWMGSKTAMILLSLPLLLLLLPQAWKWKQPDARHSLVLSLLTLGLLFQSWFNTSSYEEKLEFHLPDHEVHRDYAATVLAAGQGMNEFLFVNGISMTGLTPITKLMAHLPLAFLTHPPHSALDICFGMGTTFRSLLSWGIDTTVVDLNRGVILSFPHFYADASACELNPNAHLVVDDGRRFLERTGQKFDVITIDPPPPIEAAGSSLLYSVEFYQLAKSHLTPGGVLQQWYPGDSSKTLQAVSRSLVLSFRYVRMYRSIANWGYHFIASDSPLPVPTVSQILKKMPTAARKDMLEWYSAGLPASRVLQVQLSHAVPIQDYLGDNPQIAVRDNKPYNEYFLMRQIFTGRIP